MIYFLLCSFRTYFAIRKIKAAMEAADHRCSVKEGKLLRIGAPELELVWTIKVK